MSPRKNIHSKLYALAVALAAVLVNVQYSFAQDIDQEKERAEVQRRQILCDKFNEIGQKAELNKDYVMAAGMFEAALERTSKQDQYMTALLNVARCYTKLGYFWRVNIILEKVTVVAQQNPNLVTESVVGTFKDHIDLMHRINKGKDATKCQKELNLILANREKRQTAQTIEITE